MCGCEHRTSHAGGVVPPGPWPVAGWAHVVSVTLKKPSRRPLWVCFALPPHCVSSLKAYLHQHNA